MQHSEVEAIADGSMTTSSVTDSEFRRWIASLGLVRVSERPVEGLHSRISSILRRSPNSSMPYVSNELRFQSFCELVLQDPQASWQALWNIGILITITIAGSDMYEGSMQAISVCHEQSTLRLWNAQKSSIQQRNCVAFVSVLSTFSDWITNS